MIYSRDFLLVNFILPRNLFVSNKIYIRTHNRILEVSLLGQDIAFVAQIFIVLQAYNL